MHSQAGSQCGSAEEADNDESHDHRHEAGDESELETVEPVRKETDLLLDPMDRCPKTLYVVLGGQGGRWSCREISHEGIRQFDAENVGEAMVQLVTGVTPGQP